MKTILAGPLLAGLLSSAAMVLAGEAADPKSAPPPPPEIKDEELQRVPRKACETFPWVIKAKEAAKLLPPAPPVPVVPPKAGTPGAPPASTGALPDMSSGDRIIRAFGNFSAAPGATPDKSVLELNKDIEINLIQPESVSVLRAQHFRLTQDVKTGQTELLEANGLVEMVMPERKGRGETLVYETKYGPHDEIIKDLFTLEGDHSKNKKAVLWQGLDVIEADKFIDDRRLETFRALGSPAAVVTIPVDTTAPTPDAPAKTGTTGTGTATGTGTGTGTGMGTATASSGMLPSFSMTGGKIRLQCEGELFYEGPSGRVTLNRNAVIQQQGDPLPDGTPGGAVKISSDEAHLILNVPPPGQPTDNASMFSGSLKTMEGIGRAEIKTATHIILCDRVTIDMQRNTVLMEMKNPKEDVHIYIKDDPPGTGRTMLARKSLLYNTITSDMQSPFGMKMEPLPETIPSNRPGGVPTKTGAPPPKTTVAQPKK